MQPQKNTFDQLLLVQRKLNEKTRAGEEAAVRELEAEKQKLWKKLSEENLAAVNAIMFKPLDLYPFRPAATTREFINETVDLWGDQPDWLLILLQDHYWEKDNKEGRFYKQQTYETYLGIRNILIQNLSMSGPDGQRRDRYIGALLKPRRWLSKLEKDLQSVGKRLDEIAPALQRRTPRILLLPSTERKFVVDDPGEDEKLLKEAQESFPNAAVVMAADLGVLNSMKDRKYPDGAIVLTRFWISRDSLRVMAAAVKMFNKDLSKWKIDGSPVRRRGAPKLVDAARHAGIEICRFLKQQFGTPDYELASKILNQLAQRSRKKYTPDQIKKAFLRSGT
jgi:hypothetical protein